MRPPLLLIMSGLTVLATAQTNTPTTSSFVPTTFITSSRLSTNPSSAAGFTTAFQLVSGNVPSFSSSAAASSSTTHPDPVQQTAAASATDYIDPHTMDGFPDSSDHGSTETDSQTHGAINYYFIFIGVAIGLLMLAVWALYRRKRALKAIRRTHNRRNAATRDISNAWRGTGGSRRGGQGRSNSSRRRWMQRGAPWHNRSVETEPPVIEREEGLNELGEAPPAYVKEIYGNMAPRITVSSVRSLTPEDRDTASPVVVIEGPAIPLRCLSSNERERPQTGSSMGEKPPDYDEATSAANTPIPSSPPTFLSSSLYNPRDSPV